MSIDSKQMQLFIIITIIIIISILETIHTEIHYEFIIHNINN